MEIEYEDDVFNGYGVLVDLNDRKDFLVIEETLKRIGYPSQRDKKLFQSCHIFHKRGQYAIVHYKEMFLFDGANIVINDEDYVKRNKITQLLQQWNLLSIADSNVEETKERIILPDIVVVPFKDKHKWTLESKYTFGGAK